jgi:23S rRNA (cytidine1920-2'-O)/16S rRNA (cytidine1409-2'-O)-methyltransferase
LDILLVQRELAETRERAQALILAGEVEVNGRVVSKAGTNVATDAVIEVRAALPYVSRGGYKLAGALDAFAIDARDKTCADIGASTGGFTDVLLQRGAMRVYALDVGYGQLAWKIRNDPRVVVMERVNVRHLESLPERAELVTIDVSFISLEIILRRVVGADGRLPLLSSDGEIIALVKPQFEAGREQVGKGGIVRDARVHRQVLEKICAFAESVRLAVRGLIVSPILGTEGNREFLIRLATTGESMDWKAKIEQLA